MWFSGMSFGWAGRTLEGKTRLSLSSTPSNSVKKSQPTLPISTIDERLQQYTQATEVKYTQFSEAKPLYYAIIIYPPKQAALSIPSYPSLCPTCVLPSTHITSSINPRSLTSQQACSALSCTPFNQYPFIYLIPLRHSASLYSTSTPPLSHSLSPHSGSILLYVLSLIHCESSFTKPTAFSTTHTLSSGIPPSQRSPSNSHTPSN